jgi:hypothetical protein
MNHYHAQLVADIGLPPPGFSLGKLMVPLTAADYAAVFFHMSQSVGDSTETGKGMNTAASTSNAVLGQRRKGATEINEQVEAPVAAVTLLQAGTHN